MTRTSLPGWTRLERAVLVTGLLTTTVAVVSTRAAVSPGWIKLWDNVHWTAAFGTAALLVALARRRADGVLASVRGWFAISMAMMLGGQLLWDVQVVVGWNPFPAPSDVLWVMVGPFAIVGLWTLTRGQSRARRASIALDALGFAAAMLALVLALYLPRRGQMDGLTMTFMTAYPTALLTAGALFAVIVIELPQRIRREVLLLEAALLALGLLWMQWNLDALLGRLGDARAINYAFSYGVILLGAAMASYTPDPGAMRDRSERAYHLTSRVLPLVLVVSASAAVLSSYGLPGAVRTTVDACMALVILVAVIRQSLLLEDTDRRLAAEARDREVAERLKQAQRLESLGTLASGIAHDFNNVLTAILGNTELLAESEGLDAESRESVAVIGVAARRARDVVARILAFSRPESPARETIDMAALSTEVATLLRAAIPARHLLHVLAEPGQIVHGNPAQIHQVLMNLGTNASHAIGDRAGNIRFEVRRHTLPLPGVPATSRPVVALEVSDDGSGMDETTSARVFEPFFTTKERDHGTGLGLSVVHGIITDHGGTIRLSSRPGKGTTFTIELPAAPAGASGARGPVVADTAARPARRDQRILIVDDEPEVVALLARIMRTLGCEVCTLTRAEDAVTLVRDRPGSFSMVVTDMSMPGFSGSSLAAALREIGYAGPIVVSSGTDFVVTGTLFTDALPKPYTVGQVRALLERTFGGESRQSPGIIEFAGPPSTA